MNALPKNPTLAPDPRMAADRLAEDFRMFVADVEQLLKNASSLSGEGLAAARAKLEDKVAQAKLRLSDVGSVAADRAAQARRHAEGYVQERPWTALGVAALVGTIAALLITRR